MPFRRSLIFCIVIFQLFCNHSFGSPTVKVSPAPGWIVPVKPAGKAPSAKDYADGYYLSFSDYQVHLGLKTAYSRMVRNIESESGIQNGSEISVTFDPTYERIEFHTLIIWRDGKAISQLKISDFKIAPFEADRQRFIYNGDYTASLVLKDIRKGDKIEYSFSRVGWNAVFEGKYSGTFSFSAHDYIGHLHYALISPALRLPLFRDFNSPPKKSVRMENGQQIFEWDLKNIKSKPLEEFLPSWYHNIPFVQITEFKDWADVVNWGLRVYQSEPVSGKLKEKIEQWKKEAKGSKWTYFELATRFVQDEIRYLGIETGENSHRPHPPKEVFEQRYGDCKDKTFLLCAILKANDIDAVPMLVDTYNNGHLSEYLPTPLDFNHVVVQVRTEGMPDVYVDATYSLQGGTSNKIFFPPYGQGLAIRPGQKTVTDIKNQFHGNIKVEEEFTLPAATDTSGTGYLMVKSIYYDSEADRFRNFFQDENLSETEESYLNFYRDIYKKSEIESADSLEYYDQRNANNFSIVERYKIKNAWVYDSTRSKYYFYPKARIMYDQMINLPNRKRVGPVALNYPYHLNYAITIKTGFKPVVVTNKWEVKRNSYIIRFKSEYSEVDNGWVLSYEYLTLKDFVAVEDVKQLQADVERFMNSMEYILPSDGADSVGFSELNYAMIFWFLFSIAVGGYICFRLYQFSPGASLGNGTRRPIGLWLCILWIGVMLNPISVLYGVITNGCFNLNTWAAEGFVEENTKFLYRFLLLGETFSNGLLLSASILVAILFIKQRSTFPPSFAIFCAMNIVTQIVDIVFVKIISDENFYVDSSNEVINVGRTIIFSAIWIAYLFKSQEVKNVFVNGYRSEKKSLESETLETEHSDGVKDSDFE